jgi:hypothetical protein
VQHPAGIQGKAVPDKGSRKQSACSCSTAFQRVAAVSWHPVVAPSDENALCHISYMQAWLGPQQADTSCTSCIYVGFNPYDEERITCVCYHHRGMVTAMGMGVTATQPRSSRPSPFLILTRLRHTTGTTCLCFKPPSLTCTAKVS